MNVEKKTYLALDTSCEHAVVVLFSESVILFEQVLSERNAHGRHLIDAMAQALAVAKTKNLSLAALFVGLGPGSFIGLRVGLATALGFTCARSLPLMGFCSHQALAYSLEPDGQKIALAMKASGDLCYFSVFCPLNNPMLLAPEILNSEQISLRVDNTYLLATNRPDILGNINIIYGPSPQGVLRSVEKRLISSGLIDESDHIKPNYVKEPNVSLPKAIKN